MPMHDPQASDLAGAREIAREVGLFWRQYLPVWLRLNLDVGLLLDRGLARLIATNLWGPANREPSQLLWQEAGEVLRHGWLQLRAREKPRGYAGDHEMLGAIYHHRVTGDPLGIAFDHYFLGQAAPQAVRNRMDLVSGELHRSKVLQKVVVVGSGAGLEIDATLREERLGTEAEYWLLDLDPAAVELAEKNLRPLLPAGKLHCRAENLMRLPKKRQLLSQLQDADLVICTGFFDYLEDDAAAELLKTFEQLLRPGGQALVFNFAPWNPTRAYMEWIGNWYLLYRTREDLVRLANRAGVTTNDVHVSAESSGIDLLLRLAKSG